MAKSLKLSKEGNRKPLKDRLLLQGLNCGKLKAEAPHSRTPFIWLVQ